MDRNDLPNEAVIVTCSACPTQIEGIVRGHYVYFRERHGYWSFSIDGKSLEGKACKEGMSVKKALKKTNKLIQKYMGDKLAQFS